jgi:ribosome-associated translation inhibitor RaiA
VEWYLQLINHSMRPRLSATGAKLMQVQVHTDNHIEGSAGLSSHVQSVIEDGFARFGERITRIEVYLRDENSSQKSGENDKRCVIEARVAGIQPVSVTADASTVDEALNSAVDKLDKVLDRTLGRLDDPKGRVSFSGDPL